MSDLNDPPVSDDVWKLDEDFKTEEREWSKLKQKGKIKYAGFYLLLVLLALGLLYIFICSLSFLADSFRLLGGKDAGRAFRQNEILDNPIAGLMIGILATVLVQSSSTSTSIVVSMVGSGILGVRQSIPIIMGANIGTSVTNSIVSIAHINKVNEFRRAFAAATVHDFFNWLSVLILLPLELATRYLERLTDSIIKGINTNSTVSENPEFLKKITKPFTNLVIQLDKKIITLIAQGVNETELEGKQMIKEEGNFLFHDTGLTDSEVGIILLIISLILLCVSLFLTVKILHRLFRGRIAVWLHKTVNRDFPDIKIGGLRIPTSIFAGYLAMAIGVGMTILVQSSSITTSTLTPLVGMGVITIERAYPITLGSNIGTTVTGILAALSSDGTKLANALQVALAHLFFNISGIIIWYPIPFMRKIPISAAKAMGNTTAKYRWFAIVYIIIAFFLFPVAVFGLSIISNWALIGVGVPFLLLMSSIVVTNILQKKKPSVLPEKLRDWEWLPLYLHSLRPYDSKMKGIFSCCKREETTEIEIENC